MHKTEPNFKGCLQLGAAERLNGTDRLFRCLRTTPCDARFDFGGKKFCKTPLSENITKEENARAKG